MDLIAALEQGSHPAALVALALLLGALHGLEPGHAKTLMAAFIIAVRGTVLQAVLLGLSAALSHSLVVWVLALLALHYGGALSGGTLEPWFEIGSGVIILALAGWLLVRLRPRHQPDHDHDHSHDHGHSHDHAHPHDHSHDHSHDHDPPHPHPHPHLPEPEDAHARAHAAELARRFGPDGRASLRQTIVFGLTGGLIPCTAAVTVLLMCLHVDRFWLGVGLVSAFSAGLALTLVAVGVATATGLRWLGQRTTVLDRLLARAPVLSALLVAVVGLWMVLGGWWRLTALG